MGSRLGHSIFLSSTLSTMQQLWKQVELFLVFTLITIMECNLYDPIRAGLEWAIFLAIISNYHRHLWAARMAAGLHTLSGEYSSTITDRNVNRDTCTLYT